MDFPVSNIFLAWFIVRKEGIMDFLRVYLSCHKRSSFTVGSDATKNWEKVNARKVTVRMLCFMQVHFHSIQFTMEAQGDLKVYRQGAL